MKQARLAKNTRLFVDGDGYACCTTQAEAGRQLGVSERVIASRLAAGCRGRRGKYRLVDLASWNRQPNDDDDVDPAAGVSPALEKLRNEKYLQAAMETKRLQRELVRLTDLHDALLSVTGVIRGCGERLRQQFGNDALSVLNEAIDEAERTIQSLLPEDEG